MVQADLDPVKALSDRIHPGLVERREVFADRLDVFPAGCLVLVAGGEIAGYGVSHPAKLRDPPHLDRLLGSLRPDADSYYLHDVALSPEQRGTGRAGEGVERLLSVAAVLPRHGADIGLRHHAVLGAIRLCRHHRHHAARPPRALWRRRPLHE